MSHFSSATLTRWEIDWHGWTYISIDSSHWRARTVSIPAMLLLSLQLGFQSVIENRRFFWKFDCLLARPNEGELTPHISNLRDNNKVGNLYTCHSFILLWLAELELASLIFSVSLHEVPSSGLSYSMEMQVSRLQLITMHTVRVLVANTSALNGETHCLILLGLSVGGLIWKIQSNFMFVWW